MQNLYRFRTFLLCICVAAMTTQVLMATEKPKDVDPRLLWSRFDVSPDGKKIAYPVHAYDNYGDLTTQVWVSDLSGSGKKQIVSIPGIQGIGWYDKSHLTVMSFESDAIKIVSLDGKQRTISLTDRFNFSWPVISPDGKWVAFSASQKNPQKMGIFLLDIKTGEIRTLSSDTAKTYVAWSPNSKKIAYGEGDYQKDYKLKILDIEIGQVVDTGQNGVGAEWSHDGKWLAYTGNIIRGGSWMNGVPTDGSIVKINVESKETKVLTEPGVNREDNNTKSWEMSGSLYPAWSHRGDKIAYRRIHTIRDKDKQSLNEDEIWVVNADGTGRKKLKDKWSPFVWAPDGKAILVKTATDIERVAIDTGKSKSLVAWQMPVAPQPKSAQTITGDGAEVTFSGVKPEYAKALLAVAAEARRVYANTFGFDMPEKLSLNIEKKERGRPQLWTDGQSQMFLTITSTADLAPPMQSGTFNIFGMCHELGHMVMYRKAQLIGLPDGIGEGWAYYAGSVVVDHVYKKLGQTVWPQPYNYSEVEGTARLARNAEQPDAAKDATTRAAMVFYKIQQRFGEDKVMAAMKIALEGNPMGKDVMPRFADALAKVTNDESARAMVPDEFLTFKIDWKVAEREINEKTTQGQVLVEDQTGVLLKYDSGASEQKMSTAGAGHAIMFYAPPGSWAVDFVQLYGARYGEADPPKENFFIFICDQDFNVIKTIEKPYSTFERDDPKWYTMSFDPIKVPRGFYVCVYFAPTATKGIYVYYNTSTTISHSRSALPWTFVYDLRGESKNDWMIRAHLVKRAD